MDDFNRGVENYYSDITGEVYGDIPEDEVLEYLKNYEDIFNEETAYIDLNSVKNLIKRNYWRYTDDPHGLVRSVYD